MTTITGRIRQTVQLITAWTRPVADDLARTHLTSAEFGLYLRMSRAERQHHLRVLQDLLTDGHHHPALLKAALLHDVGKTRYFFSLPQKVLVVLVKTFAPRYFVKWGADTPNSWKRPFVVSAQHPAWSAEMCAAIGSDALTIELIRRHQSEVPSPPQTEADRLLLFLQAADDRS